jgi:hypothetical protein
MKIGKMGWQWICRPDAFVGVYAAIDREGIAVLVVVAVLVKDTVDMVLDVLVVEFQWARRKG